METRPRALLIAGPTASGKSALALDIAERIGGTVVNADSMQVYAELRVLTARPTAEQEAHVPHALYGVLPAATAGSVAWWRDAALAAMAAAHAAGRLPILCGGTGMYFAALTEGLAQLPPVPDWARVEARALAADPPALHARLAQADPATAARLRPTDTQRLARAWEVWCGTGRGLAAWQQEPGLPPAAWDFCSVLLDPPRTELRAAIAARFDAMLAAGALGEVRALAALRLDPALPAMRAHGVPGLLAHLRGEVSVAAARDRAVLETGQYTKRQATWFRHHRLAPEARTHNIHARYADQTQLSADLMAKILSFVHCSG
jgi:tRNA dimethylallyltransferase